MSPSFAIFAGIRTPFGKAGGALADYFAEDLGAMAARELLLRTGVRADAIDGVVAGNVGQSSRAANVARVIGLRAGVPERVPAWTVHRNCASGIEAVSEAADQVALGRGTPLPRARRRVDERLPARGQPPRTRLVRAAVEGEDDAARSSPRSPSARPSIFAPKVALLEGPHRSVRRPQHGPDRRAARARVEDHARGAGRVRAREPAEGGGRGAAPARRDLRRRHEDRRAPRRRRRAARFLDGEAREAQARVREDARHGDAGQLEPDHGRRRGAARRRRGARPRARPLPSRRSWSPSRTPGSIPRAWASARSTRSTGCSRERPSRGRRST